MGEIYICSGNCDLLKTDTDISFSWEKRYIGRKIIREKYNELFDHNGYYPENEEYEERGILINLSPEVDDQGYITGIEYYKMLEISPGPGRPVTSDKKLTSKDINLFSNVLDTVTEDYITSEYDLLCGILQNSGELRDGYSCQKINKSGISFITPDHQKKSLSAKKIIQALYLSHFYIDVLFCEDTLRAAPNLFKEEDIPLYLAVFSVWDYSNYRNLESLLLAAKNRSLYRTAQVGYPALKQAVIDGNLKSAEKYADYACIVNSDDSSPLLLKAVENSDIPMAKLLLQHSAYSIQSILDEQGISHSPLYAAVQKKNYDLIQELVNHCGAKSTLNTFQPRNYFKIQDVYQLAMKRRDFKALSIILPAANTGIMIRLNPSMMPCSLEKTIRPLAEIPGAKIAWPVKYIKKAYLDSKELCYKMLRQGSTRDVIDFLIEENDLDAFEVCLSEHPYLSEPPKLFSTVLLRDPKWYELIKEHTSSDFNHMQILVARDQYLGKLIENQEYEEYIRIVEHQNWGILLNSLEKGFIGSARNIFEREKLDQFANYVLDHIEYQSAESLMYDLGIQCFSEAVFRYASLETCMKCLQMFPARFLTDSDYFTKTSKNALLYRNDGLFEYFVRYQNDSDNEKKYVHLFQLLDKLVRSCRFIIVSHEEEELAKHKYGIKYIIDISGQDNLEHAMVNQVLWSPARGTSLREYAIAQGIRETELLSILEKN